MSLIAEPPTVEDRLGEFFTALHLQRVHVASGHPLDAVTLARTFADRIASMVLVSPGRVPPEAFRAFDTRLLLIAGDRGPNAPFVPALLQDLPHARARAIARSRGFGLGGHRRRAASGGRRCVAGVLRRDDQPGARARGPPAVGRWRGGGHHLPGARQRSAAAVAAPGAGTLAVGPGR